MSIHIAAKPGEIASTVLMPGDPLRAKHIAENYLEDFQMVSSTRNIYFFTGRYKGEKLTIGASGMGCPSIGIYSYELYHDYNVQTIMRIGTCGAYYTNIHLFDLINVDKAFSESTYAKYAFGFEDDYFDHQGRSYDTINQTAVKMNIPVLAGNIHSGDPFYRVDAGIPKIAQDNNCLAAEMEAFALFANARHFNRSAACLLTVSDIIPAKKMISAEEREKSLDPMTRLALETAIVLGTTG